MLGFRSLGRTVAHRSPAGPGADGRNAAGAGAWTRAPGVADLHGPGWRAFADVGRGALTVRLQHRGVPLDAVLSAGLESGVVGRLGLPRPAVWTPRLYAGFGGRVGAGVTVPTWARPSPLAYVFRVLGDDSLTEPLARLLLARRFEFLDFDVV